ncbi:MAG TPA: hypothetical protein VIN09_08075 [Chloroflexota bacterium]
MPKLGYCEKIGRVIRMEDPPELGVATQTLVEEAVRQGRADEAVALLDYMRQEFVIMNDILAVWVQDTLEYLHERLWQSPDPSSAARATTGTFFAQRLRLGLGTRGQAERAIRAGRTDEALSLVERLRQEFKGLHDALIAWEQDLLTYLADTAGEDAVAEAILRTNERIWKPRYELWERMTPQEKLWLTVEGMRGHFSGPGRRGDVQILEEEDRYVISFDPCGSGGVLRRGDPETEGLPLVTHGTNRTPHPWTWGKTGVHWYCTHCCIIMEWHSIVERGYPYRPLAHTLDHHAPCVWYIYKRPELTRDVHYANVGMERPPRFRASSAPPAP